MDINYELYKVFYCVAISLSFSEASKQLFISQSAVSQSIKTLERKLDSKLFQRSTKKVSLTPEGEMLFKHVEPAMNLIRHGEKQLLESNSLNGGQLRIGASDTICRYYLVPYLNEFHQKYPNVHVKVMNQTSLKCVELLTTGQVDLVIINHPNAALNDTINVKELKKFQDVFLGGEKYATISKEAISLKELQKHPILMLDRKSTTSEFLHQIFQRHHLDLAPEIELSSNDLLLDLARIGFGIAFVPDFCIPKDSKDLFLISTLETLPSRELVVAYSNNIPLSVIAQEFLIQLQEKQIKTH
ncbi:MAG: LysR family transcriptional regulator [Clostridiales bacterium]|nr:LysR family transcriptional regulator [Clostridiales bacterium]